MLSPLSYIIELFDFRVKKKGGKRELEAPTIPSHEGSVEVMASHHDDSPSEVPPTIPSHEGSVDVMASHHASGAPKVPSLDKLIDYIAQKHDTAPHKSGTHTLEPRPDTSSQVPSHQSSVDYTGARHANVSKVIPRKNITHILEPRRDTSTLGILPRMEDEDYLTAHYGPPNIPSHDDQVDYMASHHAASPPSPVPTIPSHERYIDYLAANHANMTNMTNLTSQNLTLSEVGNASSDFSTAHVDEQGLVIMSYILLGLFFVFLLGIIGIDMKAKYRTGELRDDMRGIKKMLLLALKAFPVLFMVIGGKIRSIFSKKEEELDGTDAEAAAKRALESQAIVERLAAKQVPSLGQMSSESGFTVVSLGGGLNSSR